MCQYNHAKSKLSNLWRMKPLGMCQYDQAKSKNHVTWRKFLDLCQYDQIKNHDMEKSYLTHVNMTKPRAKIEHGE